MGSLLVNMASWIPTILCRSGNRGYRSSIRGLANLTSSSGLKIEVQPFNKNAFLTQNNPNFPPLTLNLVRSLHQDGNIRTPVEHHKTDAVVPETEEPLENEETFEEHEMTVYRGILSTQIKLVKSFSLMTSVIGLSCQPLLYLKISESSGASLAVIAVGGAFMSFFTFATPLLIHWVSKKYVTELLYNKIENKYTAVTYSFLLRRKEITFKLDDVKVPDLPGMFTTFKVNGSPLFVDGSQFFVPQHYGKIMGYDKPIDLLWRDGRTKSHADALEKEQKKNKER